MSKRPPFTKAATLEEVPEATVRHVFVHDKPIALCHMGGPLAAGNLAGCILACPWHGWTFDVRTGQPDHPGGHSISAYEVRLEGNDILIGWLKKSPA